MLACLLALVFTVSLAGCAWQSDGQAAAESSAPFYTDRVVTVRFVMTEDDWTYLQENAREENYVRADMWYDGELVPDIALRPKGNSSLASTIAQGSIRFSLKADLNLFNSARNLDGVKKLNFNNGFSDPSFMREILSYEIFEQMGLPTPRASFVDVWINDTHLGLYTMVEQVDQTFLRQHFTDATGNLYKPEMPAGYLNWTEEDVAEILASQDTSENSLDVNLGGANLMDILKALGWEFLTEEETETNQLLPGIFERFNIENRPANNAAPGFGIQQFPNLPPSDNITNNFTRRNVIIQGGNMAPAGGMGLGSRGDYLEQMGLKTNENKPDYDALFHFLDVLNNEPDETFVTEIEKVLDVDQVLRFLAVSAALVHLDNYIGMGHNYYLYEVNGKFTIIPWDLNMSFGGFGIGMDGDSSINFLIDEPTSGAVADRPLVARLLAVPSYLETYHGYLTELINGPFSVDAITYRIDELADLIRPYVRADTLKFYPDRAFEVAVGNVAVPTVSTPAAGMVMGTGVNIDLKTFVEERIASIDKQLAGEIPSTNNGRGNGGNFFMGRR